MNLQEKLSGLKGLVSHSHSKRRFKSDLTVEMISPPLGDFRHTMHVGRGGDVFGDTSFLSNHGGTANGNSRDTESISTPDNKIGAFFSRTLRQIRRGSDNRPREASKELSPPPPAVSPIIKNAISLPRLDVDLSNGSPTAKVLFPSTRTTPEEKKSSYGLESGFVTLPRLSRSERQQPSISLPASRSPPNIHRGSLTDPSDAILSSCSAAVVTSHAGPLSGGTGGAAAAAATATYSDSLPSLASLDTFTFDLGPSLMSEVFGLIDGHHHEEHGHAWEREEAGSACGLTNEGSEMDSATISYVDSLLREDCGGQKSPHAADWEAGEEEEEDQEEEEEEEEEEGREGSAAGENGLSGKVPDVAMASPERARSGMGMESERFQSAADVLARHYAVSPLKGQCAVEAADSEVAAVSQHQKKMSYSYTDDEDEIKV